MATYIEMPKLADTMTEGTLVKWRKKIGDVVAAGDVVAEVETDKATMEMEAFDDGILKKILVQEGEKVPIGAHIALLLAEGEPEPTEVPGSQNRAEVASSARPPDHSDGVVRQNSLATRSSEKGNDVSSAAARSNRSDRVKSSPLARKLAREQGIEISSLSGTGPGGRVVARDVATGQGSTGARGKGQEPLRRAAGRNTPVAPAGPGDRTVPLTGMRRIIAERLLESKTQIPHFYLHIEVDAGPLMALRADLNLASEAAGGPKLTVNDFVLKAVVDAAVKVPAVNAAFAGEAIIEYAQVHLAVAIAVEEGLVTPVIRDASQKSLKEISQAVRDLATRARSKRLKPEEFQGGTVTVSSLGAYGIEFFDAIINPPQALIVSVGAIVKKPVVGEADQIVVGQRLAIGLSADHRVVDGAIGAKYLAELRRLLESPTLMLM